jgi:hypothetical protein
MLRFLLPHSWYKEWRIGVLVTPLATGVVACAAEAYEYVGVACRCARPPRSSILRHGLDSWQGLADIPVR